MAMNKYMHPRNIYKEPPNFQKLALEFPEFLPFVKQEITGKVTLDFKDLNALRALSCILLKKDFGLVLEIPLNKLIPTIPLRLNYILWIEDLLSISKKTENIKGIDVGTGASCIYPLLAAKKNKWFMIATEKDSDSIECAKNNVERNNLQHLIEIIDVKSNNLLEGVIECGEYDFCMCNPPFFSSTQELHPFFKSRKSSRPHPKNAFCASVNEVVSKGGEVEFITKLIKESRILDKQVKIYSTMIGHKCNLPPLKKTLREMNVTSFKESYFCQGNTTRWGLAWTFCEDCDLKKVHEPIKQIFKCNKTKQPLLHQLPLTNVNEYSLSLVSEKLLQMFKELQFVTEEVSRNKKVLRYFVTAFSNTWSNQRRKRREKIKSNDNSEQNSMEEVCEHSFDRKDPGSLPIGNNNNIDDPKSPGKRLNDDHFDGSFIKKLKITTDNSDTAVVFFKFTIAIKIDEDNVVLELNCVDESSNREHLHQILQYIKNNLKV